ncbi:MAG: hypothetical protein WKG07_39375 [Hymenobacter sp.]
MAGILLLTACQSDSEHPAGLPQGQLAALQGTWLLVPEASHDDTLTYRRNTYRFRYRPGGRPGFQLGPGGGSSAMTWRPAAACWRRKARGMQPAVVFCVSTCRTHLHRARLRAKNVVLPPRSAQAASTRFITSI